MANATHLTIGTVDRLSLGEPEDELRQEVQVSVTYALSLGDTDLSALAGEKAVEVRQAQEAAWHRISGFSPEAHASNACTGGLPLTAGNGALQNGAPQHGRYLNGHANEQDKEQDDDKDAHRNGHVNGPLNGQHNVAARSQTASGNGARSHVDSPQAASPPPVTIPPPAPPAISRDWITKTQKLAIQSLVKRRELTPPELERMLEERFHKRLLVMLTKVEAASLLLALERGSWDADEPSESEDEYAEVGHGMTIHAA